MRECSRLGEGIQLRCEDPVVVGRRECAFLETASERAEFPVPAGNDMSAKWPSEGMRATDRA